MASAAVVRKGNYKGGQPRYPSLAAALWSRVDIKGPDECWPWTASIGSHGYGQFSWEGKVICAHVATYMLTKGPVPVDLNVLHSCDYKPCCNPAHVYAGTQARNNLDARERGQAYVFGKGEDAPRAKLTVEDVAYIKVQRRYVSYGKKLHQVLAKQFGVHPDTISSIWSGRTWKGN
jgi:hypothetical protein